MTANEMLNEIQSEKFINETIFNQLQAKFLDAVLHENDYINRLKYHRNPIEVKNEMKGKLSTYVIEIQNRPEMTYFESGNKYFVPSGIADVWMNDKRIKSLYKAVALFCKIQSKDLTIIAVHIAEYRAMYKLFNRIKASIHREATVNYNNQLSKNGANVPDIYNRVRSGIL